jgi:hypothetical protein
MKKDERYQIVNDYFLGSINIKGHIIDIVNTSICSSHIATEPCDNMYVTFKIFSIPEYPEFTECLVDLQKSTQIIISEPDNVFEVIL